MQPVHVIPAEHAGQHEPAPTRPWQWPDPSAQQAEILKTILTIGEAAIDCFAMTWVALCVTSGLGWGLGLFLSGHACEVPIITNVSSARVITTWVVPPIMRLAQLNALLGDLHRRFQFRIAMANMPRPFRCSNCYPKIIQCSKR